MPPRSLLPMTVEVFAPAKINLTLHVTGRRDDGLHLLDSLVVFADVGDCVTVSAADALSLTISGEQAADVPADARNLMLRAATLLAADRGAELRLEKRLPVAAGIGGGSSDAAATLHALGALWGVDLPDKAALMQLGADLAVCLHAGPARMSGVGEIVSPVTLPDFYVVLVSPGISLATSRVFEALGNCDNPAMPTVFPRWQDAAELFRWLVGQRNDLEAPARGLVPEIDTVLGRVTATEGCGLARMSGSGATCFGLYETASDAARAAAKIAAVRPDWWVADAGLWRDA